LFDGDKDLYIDLTICKNINNSEYVETNHYDCNRNGNKISLVVTKKGIPVRLKLFPRMNMILVLLNIQLIIFL